MNVQLYKIYRTRCGKRACVAAEQDQFNLPFEIQQDARLLGWVEEDDRSVCAWSPTGRVYIDKEHPFDLMDLWTAPIDPGPSNLTKDQFWDAIDTVEPSVLVSGEGAYTREDLVNVTKRLNLK